MQDDNLPADRMVLVRDVTPEHSVLVNVDDLESVKQFDHRPLVYMGPMPQPYGRGLMFSFKQGNSRLVETRMTLQEFEMERAKKFIPVETEKSESIPEKAASSDEMFSRTYKQSYLDYGVRLTSLVRLGYEQAMGNIYQGLFYDSSEYPAFDPRYVMISLETLEKDWAVIDE